ncbi:MAG: GGDEF domain-containing protein [Hespellia sp.]|nr:GGDEF domain-containing protein [Hespellia sp.]
MKNGSNRLKDLIGRMNMYFTQSQDTILESNISLVQGISLFGFFSIGLLAFLASYLIEGWTISIGHILFLPFFVINFIWASLLKRKKKKQNIEKIYQITQVMVVTFMLSFLGLILYIEIVPYPTQTATLVAPAMMMLSVIFIVPFYITSFFLCVSYLAFCALSLYCLNSQIMRANVFNGLVGVVFGLWGAWIVTNLRAREERTKQGILWESQQDKLTGVLNKSAAEQKCIGYLEAYETDHCALIVIDVDDFKNVNDRYGHQMGDQVLNILGKTLQKVFRDWDIKGRIGGDEFIVLMKHMSDQEVIKKKMQFFEELFSQATTIKAHTKITCSYGVAVKKEMYVPYKTLFIEADKLLYVAKNGGKGEGKIKNMEM